MKKIILFILLFLITGCDKQIDPTIFKTRMEKNNYAVHDVIKQYDEKLVSSALIAINKSGNYQIEYLSFKSDDACKNSFQINRDEFRKNAKKNAKETSISKEKNSKYTLTTDDTFYLVSRYKNNLIYLTVDGSFKTDVEKIIKDLGF